MDVPYRVAEKAALKEESHKNVDEYHQAVCSNAFSTMSYEIEEPGSPVDFRSWLVKSKPSTTILGKDIWESHSMILAEIPRFLTAFLTNVAVLRWLEFFRE
jgi:hypothetical protein